MARDYTQYEPSDALHLSSQKLGEDKYYLKDKAARAVLDSINDDAFAALQAGLGTVAGNDGKLVTAANIKSYVDQIAEIGFDVVKLQELPQPSGTVTWETIYNTYKNNIVLIPDAQAAAGSCIEYVILRSGTEGSYTYAWEQIGSTQVDLSNYVQKTTEIAGVQIGDGITKASLQSALELGNMAYVNQGTFTVADYVNGVSSATTTASGTVTLNAFTQTATAANLSKADYTPEGTINVTLKDASTSTNATITSEAYTPEGTIESFYAIDDSITVPIIDISGFDGGSCDVSYSSEGGVYLQEDANVNLTIDFEPGSFPVYTKEADTWDAGTVTTIDTTKFSGGSLGAASTSSFTTNGIVASIDTSDSECLVFSNASKETAVTAQGTFTPAEIQTGFYTEGTAPSFVEGTLSHTEGAFPTIDQSETYGTLTSLNLSYEAPTLSVSFTGASLGSTFLDEFTYEPTPIQPTFEGSQVANMKVTNVAYVKQEVDTHTFTGSTAASILVTGVSYDKATQNGATFTGSQVDVDVTLSTTSKTVDVNPKTSA